MITEMNNLSSIDTLVVTELRGNRSLEDIYKISVEKLPLIGEQIILSHIKRIAKEHGYKTL